MFSEKTRVYCALVSEKFLPQILSTLYRLSVFNHVKTTAKNFARFENLHGLGHCMSELRSTTTPVSIPL